MIKLTFPDGNVKEFEKGISTLDVAGSISPGLKKSALAGKIDGVLIDAKTPIRQMQQLKLLQTNHQKRLKFYVTQQHI